MSEVVGDVVDVKGDSLVVDWVVDVDPPVLGSTFGAVDNPTVASVVVVCNLALSVIEVVTEEEDEGMNVEELEVPVVPEDVTDELEDLDGAVEELVNSVMDDETDVLLAPVVVFSEFPGVVLSDFGEVLVSVSGVSAVVMLGDPTLLVSIVICIIELVLLEPTEDVEDVAVGVLVSFDAVGVIIIELLDEVRSEDAGEVASENEKPVDVLKFSVVIRSDDVTTGSLLEVTDVFGRLVESVPENVEASGDFDDVAEILFVVGFVVEDGFTSCVPALVDGDVLDEDEDEVEVRAGEVEAREVKEDVAEDEEIAGVVWVEVDEDSVEPDEDPVESNDDLVLVDEDLDEEVSEDS
ncbi:hypothetical protein L5515_005004 [Caenorhabditis briggsae]|uniref:Uncharacterized protein n=1 Tax=Caenorhabditis briggsae TaxID=6238 RepID=A0AAE9JBU0_CAEBR|nr:hypothetical protein L5515_005004 [Caenorhabditis briggsae]